ncbi:hypothetical protein XENORESO_015716 [Xenotaenia resolanae]|uniref:Uncharacterized protein n=1 Tax=Xenotaenia resolanae TaxID=208358 RepID=A0ABV0VNQ3_9TELE
MYVAGLGREKQPAISNTAMFYQGSLWDNGLLLLHLHLVPHNCLVVGNTGRRSENGYKHRVNWSNLFARTRGVRRSCSMRSRDIKMPHHFLSKESLSHDVVSIGLVLVK